jgi:hypothetical protein
MKEIIDQRLLVILENGACPDLPAAVVKSAYRATRLLLAVTSLNDVTVFAPNVFKDTDGAYVAPLEGKWVVRFDWRPDLGAVSIQLERH